MKTFSIVVLIILVSVLNCSADSVQSVGKNARINWTGLYYEADGYAAVPSSTSSKSKTFLKAQESAKKDAVINLISAVKETTVNYNSKAKDFTTAAKISQKIGKVSSTTILNRTAKSLTVMVRVKVPMFGKNSLAALFIEDKSEPSQPRFMESMDKSVDIEPMESSVKIILKPDYKTAEERPQMIMKEASDDTSLDTPISNTGYTGVIIDASGYKLDRSLSPKIRRQDGTEVWGTINIDYDLVLEKGIVSYVSSMEEAKKNARAGTNPLVIKAIGKAGNKFYSDPVVSDDDAAAMLAENDLSHFFDQCNVVFIKDTVTY